MGKEGVHARRCLEGAGLGPRRARHRRRKALSGAAWKLRGSDCTKGGGGGVVLRPQRRRRPPPGRRGAGTTRTRRHRREAQAPRGSDRTKRRRRRRHLEAPGGIVLRPRMVSPSSAAWKAQGWCHARRRPCCRPPPGRLGAGTTRKRAVAVVRPWVASPSPPSSS
jgi:hypothetical protein